jgi:uncharacterized protein YegJ (DUF2314 family)
VLDNDPVDLHRLRRGEALTIERDAVEDWLYFDGDAMHGGYTVRVAMARQEGR